jgi:hypothetical protein
LDALTVRYKLKAYGATVKQAFNKIEEAGGRTGFSVSGLKMEIKPSEIPRRLIWRNADARGYLDMRYPQGHNFEVTLSAVYLATHTLEEAQAMCERIAAAFGLIKRRRLGRLDLSVDIGGWNIRFTEQNAWIAQRRATTKAMRVDTHCKGMKLTGFTVCPGNALMMRVYDKVEELKLADRAHKQPIEHALWKEAGWTGEPVTRVEFQLRSKVLKALGLTDPRQIGERMDAVWAYCTQKWVRLSVPGSATRRSRWKLDPKWELVRSVVFKHAAAPAERIHKSIGADAKQTFGGKETTDEQCMDQFLDGIFGTGKAVVKRELVQQHGLSEIRQYLINRHSAAEAYFWSASQVDLEDKGETDEYGFAVAI